jgi:hypothetical protein
VSALNFQPTHPNFPSHALLHAICAVGSLYSLAVPPTPPPPDKVTPEGANLSNGSANHGPLPDVLFYNRYKRKDYLDSFAEKHAKLARNIAEDQLWAGRRLLECVQSKRITFSIGKLMANPGLQLC